MSTLFNRRLLIAAFICLCGLIASCGGLQIKPIAKKTPEIISYGRQPVFATPDGGFVQCINGSQKKFSQVMRLNQDFSKIWIAEVQDTHHIYSISNTSDGGFYLVGNDRKSLLKLTSEGDFSPEGGIHVSQEGVVLEGGLEANENVILFGWQDLRVIRPDINTERIEIAVPWIAKSTKSGRMLWSKSFLEDEDRILSFSYVSDSIPVVNRILVSPLGEILFLTIASPWKFKSHIEKTIERAGPKFDVANFVSNIIFKLDSNGNEVARFRSNGLLGAPYLFRNIEGGFDLVEAFAHIDHPEDRPANEREWLSQYAGLRVWHLDSALRIKDKSEFIRTGLEQGFRAIQRPSGGYIFAGKDNDLYNGCGYVGLLRREERTLHTMRISMRSNCSLAGVLPRKGNESAIIFTFPEQGRVMEVFELNFSD